MASLSRRLRRAMLWPAVQAGRKLDVVRLLERVSWSGPGRWWREQLPHLPPEFPDKEEIVARTVELARIDTGRRGIEARDDELWANARLISTQYDHQVHQIFVYGVIPILAHLFVHQNPTAMFMSPDRREAAHVEKMIEARKNGLGIVAVSNHSSHLDELILGFVLFHEGLGLPLFAAGSNMMATTSLERLLMTGSYRVVRKGASKSYMSSLASYCRTLAEMGKMQGIFLEAWSGGARSRDGSLRYPRRLIALQGATSGETDVLIQPVAVSYDRVPEDAGLANRRGPFSWLYGFKAGALFRRPRRGLRDGLRGIYGRAYCTYSRPWLLSELSEMRRAENSDLELDEYVALQSMKAIARDKKVMASHLAAQGLIRARSQGISDLVEAAAQAKEAIEDYHHRTFGVAPDFEDFIRHNPLEVAVYEGLRSLGVRRAVGFRHRRRRVYVRNENLLQFYATHGDHRLYSPSAKENIVIVGGGQFGFALAWQVGGRALEEKAYHSASVTLYDPRPELVDLIADTRRHPTTDEKTRRSWMVVKGAGARAAVREVVMGFRHPSRPFPDVPLPKNVFATFDTDSAFRKATEVIVATGPQYLEPAVETLLLTANRPPTVVVATRGFDPESHRLPYAIIQDLAHRHQRRFEAVLTLAGTISPEEVITGRPGVLVLAGPQPQANALADLFARAPIQVRVSDDPVGVGLAAALVEAYVVWGTFLRRTGRVSGRRELGSYVARVSAEAARLGQALGAKPETFAAHSEVWTAAMISVGLGGVSVRFGRDAGDLFRREELTPERLAKLAQRYEDNLGRPLEGLTSIRSAHITARQLGVDAPDLAEANQTFFGE
ncbi:MAG: 1-acyl-sn-glycerol-3-phosphate acyltransferase [Proteobacteria bacterium]|nr:1-acyl-sn-glycerol-3-phosphate acyltransferase [Pseudomonadota bacterium]MBU1742550.1 1-acyl-sn-glycerol-3-phosphate acyltransferase [Pseudomonadota bacterium]